MKLNIDHLIAPLPEDVERAGHGAVIGGAPCGGLWVLIAIFVAAE